uniref:Uncharacterized protein n=1 Tax=Oryza brachyantha TaxID=4533 RepID=J3LMD2_ORYBR
MMMMRRRRDNQTRRGRRPSITHAPTLGPAHARKTKQGEKGSEIKGQMNERWCYPIADLGRPSCALLSSCLWALAQKTACAAAAKNSSFLISTDRIVNPIPMPTQYKLQTRA